ncbi:MAG: hypothetical protein EXR81_05890 [Gammaproteobacteria bacterium]|nr:hypothetical protein [Gammaproteobacteria bacterium]
MPKNKCKGPALAIAATPLPMAASANAQELPQINLSKSGAPVTIANNFSLTTSGKNAPNYGTQVSLSYDTKTQSLNINFTNQNDPHIKQNQYVENNTKMWNQEVFEMFITAETGTPKHYVEIEINPNNALFSALVFNKNGKGTENSLLYLDSVANAITHSITSKTENSWSGVINFPLSILGAPSKKYQINFFRVVSLETHNIDATNFWECTNTSCAYLAWNPTLSGATPAFHLPKYFGRLNIVD